MFFPRSSSFRAPSTVRVPLSPSVALGVDQYLAAVPKCVTFSDVQAYLAFSCHPSFLAFLTFSNPPQLPVDRLGFDHSRVVRAAVRTQATLALRIPLAILLPTSLHRHPILAPWLRPESTNRCQSGIHYLFGLALVKTPFSVFRKSYLFGFPQKLPFRFPAKLLQRFNRDRCMRLFFKSGYPLGCT